MPTPALPTELREELLHAARTGEANNAAELAREMGLAESTLRGRLNYFGIKSEVQRIFLDRDSGGNVDTSVQSDHTVVSDKDIARLVQQAREPRPSIVGAGPDVEPDIERIRESAERRFVAKANRAEEKKHQSIRFPHGPVVLFFVGDQHFGNAGTDVGRAFAEQEMINACPGSYVWQTGDVVDQYIVGKLIAENMKESLSVWEQWELAKHYLRGFGDKIVAFHAGNHDLWHNKLAGFDYARQIAPNGILYDSDEIKATIHVGHHEFRVWSRHKWQGNSIYNASHGQERAARFGSQRFDVYVGAHVHKGAMAREFVLDGSRKLALLSGTYKIEDGWAREMGFPNHDSSTAVALVLHDSGSMWATSNIQAVKEYMRAVYRQPA